MRNDAISVIARRLGISKEEFHQNYEAMGKAMIVRKDDEFIKNEHYFGHLLLSSFGLWAVYRYSGIVGRKRIPSVKIISGIHTDVVQREDGTLYLLDPQRIMFSKGNKKERHLLIDEVNTKETVLDMFAGIGYFSIPLSFKVKRVYACEINPHSFHYLLMNKRLNGTENLIPMLGDSAHIPLKNFADRIIMGHFDSHIYLPEGIAYLKDRGKIHLHQLVRRGEYGILLDRYRKLNFINGVVIRKIKSYSPSKDHVVLDIDVIKN
ncbi:MAG: hypothetical protein M1290_02035 [Candidatus Thermoplasmatota archaeon]|jgi:tRNA wybutosine-synthesizing protein 2|nr:hypothetical protein [Candidatus Thermoplasmatota archaeon]